MKITVQQYVLKHLMTKALSVGVSVLKKTEDFFEFELDGKVLKVYRADSTLFTVAQTELVTIDDSSEPTRIKISTDKLSSLVDNMDKDRPLTIEVTEKFDVLIQGGQYTAKWSQIDNKVDKTPERMKATVTFQTDTVKFIKAIERTRYVVDTEHMQYRLRNIFFEKDSCWAFDNFSYQRIDTKLGNEALLMVPKASLGVLKFLKQSGQDKTTIEYNDQYLLFKTGDDIFATKRGALDDPPFIELLKKLDKKNQGRFNMEVEKLLRCLKRIGVTAESGSLRVSLEVGTKKLIVSSEDDKANVSHETLDILFSGNTKMKKKFDVRWSLLAAALTSVADKAVVLGVDKKHLIIESKDSFGVIPIMRPKTDVKSE